MALSNDVRTQDAPALLGSLLGNRVNAMSAWKFINSNWKAINLRFSQQMIPHMLGHASSFTTPAQYLQVKSFFASHPIRAGATTIARTLERVQINNLFARCSATTLNAWLQKNYPAKPGM